MLIMIIAMIYAAMLCFKVLFYDYVLSDYMSLN